MKKIITLLLALVLFISGLFVAYKKISETDMLSILDNSNKEYIHSKSDLKTTGISTNKKSEAESVTTAEESTTKQTTAVTTKARTTTTTTTQKPQTTKSLTTFATTTTTKSSTSSTTKYAGTSNLTYTTKNITYKTSSGDTASITVTVVTGFENEMLAYINNERAIDNKSQLVLNSELSRLAVQRAAEAHINWAHVRPDGTQWYTILDDSTLNLRYAGENLAWNQTSVPQVMTDWMNSPGHRANILNYKYNNVGVAWVIAPNGDHFWAQLFAELV